MMRLPRDVVETLKDERDIRFFNITDEFYAVTTDITLIYFINMPHRKQVKTKHKRHLIFINDMMMNRTDSEEDHQSVIAHELAHVYKEHPLIGEEDFEQKADELIGTWGFNPKIKMRHGKFRTKSS